MSDVTKADTTAMTDAELERLSEQYAGMGTSDREEDRIQAWVKVLHQLSPELNRNEPTYVENGKAGDIWIAAHSLLIPGQVGFHFQQCGYQYTWVEWPGSPGSGGRPVARHSGKPAHLGGESTAIGKIDLPNGHQIIETRYHMGIVYVEDHPPFPATIAYSSSGSPVSTNWINKQWSKRNPNGSLAPAFKYLWHMTTVERSNDRGRWYLLMPKGEMAATKEQFSSGAEIAQKIKQQLLRLGDEETTTGQIDEIPF